MVDERDFLDEIIEESTELDSQFPAAEQRRELLRTLVSKRQSKGLSQTTVAALMKTSQSAVARLEGQEDAKESMIDRYAAAIGVQVKRTVVEVEDREPVAA